MRYNSHTIKFGLPRWLNGKESTCHCRRRGFSPWVWKISWRRKWKLQYSCWDNPMDIGAWWATVHGVSQSQTWQSDWACTRHILITFNTAMCVSHSVMSNFAIPWTVAHQAPLSMAFSRQEYWSGLPSLTLVYLLNPGTEPTSLTYPALAGSFFTTGATREAHIYHILATK